MKIGIIGEIHPEGWETLKKYKFNAFEITNVEENNLRKEISDIDGIIIRAAPNLTGNILKNGSNLKIIVRHGVGYDNIDIEYLNKKNIELINKRNNGNKKYRNFDLLPNQLNKGYLTGK